MNRELLQQAFEALLESKPIDHQDTAATWRSVKAIAALEAELAKPEPVVLFTDNEEGLCIQLECNGSYFWENLSENKAAEFFINAYRGSK
jgi:hypothetical protein